MSRRSLLSQPGGFEGSYRVMAFKNLPPRLEMVSESNGVRGTGAADVEVLPSSATVVFDCGE